MKIKSRKSKLPFVVAGAVALLIAASIFAYFTLWHTATPPVDDGIDYKKPSSEQIKAGNDAKKSTIEKSTKSNSSKTDGTNTPSAPLGTSLKTQITTATVQDETVYIRNDINGIYQQGSCKLTLTKDGSTVQKTAGIQPLPQSSTCKGFNIPASELSSGTWQIKLEVTINGSTAVATSQVTV